MPDIKGTVDGLVQQLNKADIEFRVAEKEALDASRVKGSALHRLNLAQKALSDYMDKLRGEAPIDTGWGRRRAQIGLVMDTPMDGDAT